VYDDADTQAMQSNLRKAQGCWARISRVLRAENAAARTCEMFYTATVQVVLLYGKVRCGICLRRSLKLNDWRVFTLVPRGK